MVLTEVGFMAGPPELVTRDFLGGCSAIDHAAAAAAKDDAGLDLERHDPTQGKMSSQRHACSPQDLNLFPNASATTSTPSKLPSPKTGSHAPYHSVCTIEKVKLALERLECQSPAKQASSPSSSSVATTTTSSIKRPGDDAVEQGDGCDSPGGMIAAACGKCLLYVLISKGDPRCPRCESYVAVPASKKKPRIDLNVEFLGA